MVGWKDLITQKVLEVVERCVEGDEVASLTERNPNHLSHPQ